MPRKAKPKPPEKRRTRRPFGSIVQVTVRGKVAPGWYARYRAMGPDGRIQTVQKKAGDTKEEAEAFLHKKYLQNLEEAELRRSGKVRDISIADFASQEYLPVLEGRATTGHLAHVISRIDAASRYFGERPMRTVTREDMEEFFAAIMRGAVPPRVEVDKETGLPKKPRRRRPARSTNTLHHVRACLQPLWKEAVARHAAQINPFQGLHLARMKEFPIPWVNQEQLRKLIAASPPKIKGFVIVLAETGLRSSEAANLRWSAVAPDFESLQVVKAKSGKVRLVPFDTKSGTVHQMLRNLHAARGAIPLDGNPLVFESLPGPNARLKMFKAAARRVGLPPTLRLHDLRHVFASHLAQAGIPLATIAELCGHSSLQMVQRYAKHVPNSAARQAIERLAAFRALPGPKAQEPEPRREAASGVTPLSPTSGMRQRLLAANPGSSRRCSIP